PTPEAYTWHPQCPVAAAAPRYQGTAEYQPAPTADSPKSGAAVEQPELDPYSSFARSHHAAPLKQSARPDPDALLHPNQLLDSQPGTNRHQRFQGDAHRETAAPDPPPRHRVARAPLKSRVLS